MKHLFKLLTALIFVGLIWWMYTFTVKATTKAAEYGYFEGQKDYRNNDIRIQYNGEHYVWVKSPWDSGKQPLIDITTARGEKGYINVD